MLRRSYELASKFSGFPEKFESNSYQFFALIYANIIKFMKIIDTDKHIDTHKKIGHIQSGKVCRCRHVGHTQKVRRSCYVGHMN